MKKLKLWNGHINGGKYDRHSIYIAAYSIKQAAELSSLASTEGRTSGHIKPYDISTYFSFDAWGNSMDGIVPTEPCVYMCKSYQDKPFKVI